MLQIRNVRIIDPALCMDEITDICVADGRIHSIGEVGELLCVISN